MSEAALQRQIQRFVLEHGGRCFKAHGNEFTTKGEPDIHGVIPLKVLADGDEIARHFVPFYVETKIAGEKPREGQQFYLDEMRRLGCATGAPTSLDEFIDIITEWLPYAYQHKQTKFLEWDVMIGEVK